MVEYYDREELFRAKIQRKKTLALYLVLLGVFIAVSVGLLVWYLTLPYKSPKIATVKVIQYALIFVFTVFSFIYLGIKFKRVNKYYHLFYNLETGIRETSTASFFEYDEDLQEKDGVDFKALIFLEWNKYKKDFYERKVLVFYEKEFPKFSENDNVRFITQGNVLISYEILS